MSTHVSRQQYIAACFVMVIYFFTDFWIWGTYMSIQRHQSTFKHLLLLKKKRNILPYFVFLCQGWGLRLLSAVFGLAAHLCYALPQAGQPITEALGAHFHTSLHPAASWASVVSSSASQLISDFILLQSRHWFRKGGGRFNVKDCVYLRFVTQGWIAQMFLR